MWTIKDNIATYKNEDFSMIEKISLINEGDGFLITDNEHIYCDAVKDPMIVATAMRELGDELQKHDMSAYTVRSCRYCGNKFPLTSKNKLFCSKNHGVYFHNLQKRIEKELDRLESENDGIPDFFEINIENIKIECEYWCDKPFYCAIALNNDASVHCVSTDEEMYKLKWCNRFEYTYEDEPLVLDYPKANKVPIWRYLQIYIMLLKKHGVVE